MDKKSQLKKEYKQKIRPAGVYQIVNKINGKVLVGRSSNLDGRFNSHNFMLRYGSHRNKELQKDWNELGEENFKFEVLELINPDDETITDYPSELSIMEELWLEKLQPYGERGYNKKSVRKE